MHNATASGNAVARTVLRETRVILLTKLDDNYGAGRVWITFLFTLYFSTFREREKWPV